MELNCSYACLVNIHKEIRAIKARGISTQYMPKEAKVVAATAEPLFAEAVWWLTICLKVPEGRPALLPQGGTQECCHRDAWRVQMRCEHHLWMEGPNSMHGQAGKQQ